MNKVEAYKWALLAAANKQGWFINTPDSEIAINARTREQAKQLANQLASELSDAQKEEGRTLATAWSPRPFVIKTMKYDISEHHAIRKAVLGDSKTAK